MALKIIDNQRALVTTSNTTITTLLTVSVPTDAILGGIIKITVRSITTATTSAFYIRQILIANVGGTASIVGTVSTIGTDIVAAALVTVVVTLSVSGSDLLIRGSGIASASLEWQVDSYMNIN